MNSFCIPELLIAENEKNHIIKNYFFNYSLITLFQSTPKANLSTIAVCCPKEHRASQYHGPAGQPEQKTARRKVSRAGISGDNLLREEGLILVLLGVI